MQTIGCAATIDHCKLGVQCVAPIRCIEDDGIRLQHHLSHVTDPLIVCAVQVVRQAAPAESIEGDDKRIPGGDVLARADEKRQRRAFGHGTADRS